MTPDSHKPTDPDSLKQKIRTLPEEDPEVYVKPASVAPLSIPDADKVFVDLTPVSETVHHAIQLSLKNGEKDVPADDRHDTERPPDTLKSPHVSVYASEPPTNDGKPRLPLAPPPLPTRILFTSRKAVTPTDSPIHDFTKTFLGSGYDPSLESIPSNPPPFSPLSDLPFGVVNAGFPVHAGLSSGHTELVPASGNNSRVPEKMDFHAIDQLYLDLYHQLNVDLEFVTAAARSFLPKSITAEESAALRALFFRKLSQYITHFLPSESHESDDCNVHEVDAEGHLSAMENFARDQFGKIDPYSHEKGGHVLTGTFDRTSFTYQVERPEPNEYVLSQIFQLTKDISSFSSPEIEILYPAFEEYIFQNLPGRGT